MANSIFPNENLTRSLSEFEFLHDPNDKASKLGVGSFASVKLAKEKESEKKYALKIISMDPAKMTASDLHNIRMEITIHRKLDHPNIIKFHDYIQKDEQAYLILDYAESGNLYSYIHKKKNIPPADVFRLFHQTCLAVQYLHNNDILHRDIKPENLLIDKDLNIKLCDFGWSTRKINERRTTFCGTYEYMAPEIVYKKTYDYRVDIWSLGILLFELMHREAPYKGRSLSEISESLMKGKINFHEDVHPHAKDLITKILKNNPDDRLSITKILSHSWVRSHLHEDTSISLGSDEKLSLREISSYNFLTTEDESSKHVIHKEKNNSRIDTLILEESKVPKQAVSPQIKKRSHIKIFGSFSGDISLRSKEQDKLSERERLRQKLFSVTSENTPLSHSDVRKRKPSQEGILNLPLKSITENIQSNKGHIKASSSLNINTLEKLIMEAKKTPRNMSRNKKIFENGIISPNFKNKINTIIHQLSSQTSTNKTSGSLNQIPISKETTHRNETLVTLPSSQSHRAHQMSTKQSAENIPTSSRAKSKARKGDDEKPSTTPNSYSELPRNKAEPDSTKKGNIHLHRKNELQAKSLVLRDDDCQNLSSPSSKSKKVNKLKLVARSPEPVVHKVSLFTSTHKQHFDKTLKSSVSRGQEKTLIINNQNTTKLKDNSELKSIANNIYRTFENKKKHGLIFAEGFITPSSKIFLALNDRRDERECKKDIVRDKENQAIFKDATLRSWQLR